MTDLFEDLSRLGQNIERYERSQNESNKLQPFNFTNTTFSPNTQLFFFVLYCLTFLLALCGNIVVIGVQLYCYTWQPFQNIKKYLINLAVSDITIGVLCVPFIFSDLVLDKWIFPNWFCPMAQFVQLLSVFVTSNILMLIGVERFTAVHRPFSAFYDTLLAKSNIIIGFVWLIGFVYAFIPVQHSILHGLALSDNQTFSNYCDSYAGFSRINRRCFIVVNFVITFFIPAIVWIFAYTSILKKMLHKSTAACSNYDQSNTSTSQQSEASVSGLNSIKSSIKHRRNRSKVIRITLTIIIVHMLFGTPIKVFQLLHEFDLIQYTTAQQRHNPLLVYIICHWMAMANSALNPVVYSFTSERFKYDIQKIVNLFKW